VTTYASTLLGSGFPNKRKSPRKPAYFGVPSTELADKLVYYRRKFLPIIADPSLSDDGNYYEVIAVNPDYKDFVVSYCIVDMDAISDWGSLPSSVVQYEKDVYSNISGKYYGVKKLNIRRDDPRYDYYYSFFRDPYKELGFGWGRPKKFKRWRVNKSLAYKLPLKHPVHHHTTVAGKSFEGVRAKPYDTTYSHKHRESRHVADINKQRRPYLSREGLSRVLEDQTQPPVPHRQLKPSAAYERKRIEVDEEDQTEAIVSTYKRFGYKLTPIDTCRAGAFWRYILRIDDDLKDYSKLTKITETLGMDLSRRDVNVLLVPEIKGIEVQVPTMKVPPLYLYDHINKLRDYNDMYLPVFIGDVGRVRYIDGDTVHSDQFKVIDLAEAPHLLVAGSTGTGKSVFLHTLIHSLHAATQYIDPTLITIFDLKGNEFQEYTKLDPVHGFGKVDNYIDICTGHEDAIQCFKFYVDTMQARYKSMARVNDCTPDGATIKNWYELLALWSVGDGYVKRVLNEKSHRDYGPIVLIIDEWADLLYGTSSSSQRNYIVESLKRLTQKGRAAGIHVVLATQSPRSDVLSGEIKNNFPTRLCFRVPTKTDSRVVLDRNGAEKLTNPGDGLLLSPLEGYQGLLTRVITPLPC
jgi:hypothetical protein